MVSLNQLLIIIVLYKEKLVDAEPFKAVLQYGGVNCFVYDNSPIADTEAGGYPFVNYIHDPINSGVSAAYNKGAEYARSVGLDWLLLFDQDTRLPINFFMELISEIEKKPGSELYAMRLYKGKSLISPSGYKYKRGYMLGTVNDGKQSLNNITFLNSGLLISLDLFIKAGGFDPAVPLYFSDFVFVNRVRAHVNEFILLPIHLQHDLSSNDMSNPSAFKVRYDLYLKGIKEAIKSESEGSFFYYLSALLRAIKLTLSMKDLFYLKSYWKILLN